MYNFDFIFISVNFTVNSIFVGSRSGSEGYNKILFLFENFGLCLLSFFLFMHTQFL